MSDFKKFLDSIDGMPEEVKLRMLKMDVECRVELTDFMFDHNMPLPGKVGFAIFMHFLQLLRLTHVEDVKQAVNMMDQLMLEWTYFRCKGSNKQLEELVAGLEDV